MQDGFDLWIGGERLIVEDMQTSYGRLPPFLVVPAKGTTWFALRGKLAVGIEPANTACLFRISKGSIVQANKEVQLQAN